MNFFYANGTPIINSLKVTSEVPLDPRLTVENIAERDSLVTNHISYDRMKVYVKSNDTKYIYHKDTGEWEIDNKFSEEDKSKLDRIDNYLIDTEHIYNPENKLLYREHSYDPNTDITTLRDHILQEARVSENGELYNGLLSKFYVNRLNNITNYLIDVSFTKGTDVPNLYLTTHSYNPDEDKTTLTNIDIPLATDDNHGLLSNLQNIKVNRIVDYVNRIDTTHTNAPDTGLTYNYNIYNPFTNANVTKTILIPLVTHTENGLTSSSDKIKIDDIETYVKSIALRQASGTEELGIDYIITNPNDQTDTPGYFNIPLVTDSRNGLVSPARKHWMDNASGVSNTGTTSDTWQLDKKDIDTRLDPNGGVIIKDSGGVAEIRNSTDSAYSDLTLNNITIKGDVTQEGRSFITEAETVEVRDNTLLLNRGETGAGVSKEFAGIEIDRGSEPKYQILFDESDDRFKVGKEGDLWCVTLRDDEADMVNGMFTTWDSSTKRLKTTNIVPSSSFLYFGDNKKVALSYNNSEGLSIYNGNNSLAIFPTANNTTFRCTGNNFQLVGKLITLNETISSTFRRVSDNSEVLYHADIVNNLTSGGTNKVLSAEQGKLLQNSITSIQGSYLPLSGGTMTGPIAVPYGWDIRTNDGNGILKILSNRSVEVGHLSGVTKIRSYLNDILHIRNDTSYKIYDEFNLPDPARLGVDQTFTGLNTFTKKTIIGNAVSPQILLDPANEIRYRYASTEVSRGYTIALGNNDNIREFTFGGYYSASKNEEYAYLSLPRQAWDASTYKFYANSLKVPYKWSIDGPDGNAILWSQTSEIVNLGRVVGTTKIRSGNTDLIHTKGSTEYIIWDKSNLPTPATSTDLANYLPLAGGNMTGRIRFPVGFGIVCEDVSGSAAYNVLRTWNSNGSTRMYVGTVNFPTYISSTASDLIHDRNGSSYLLWDSYNLPTPASTTDLTNYLPLIGGTLTGQLTIKQSVDIKLRLQSTDADNYCIIQAIDSQASQLGVFGYAGDKWVIGHNGTYYEIWDKYNLTNPVTYTTNTYNYATLRNKDGQYFTYIKAGTNGLLPHSKASLANGGAGLLGTSDWGFNSAYIGHVHTNKITFGGAGSFIDNKSGDSDHKGIGFYTSQNAACPVYVGSLCVSDSYANGAPNIPTNGIYSKGVIKSAAGFTSNFRQTNLNLAKTGNDVLYISSFTVDAAGSPGTDSNTGKNVNDGMFLTYFWVNDNAFQLAADIDGTGIAYRHYIPSSGNSTTGWKFLADTNWVVSKINSSTSNFLKKTGDTATGQIILDSNGLAFNNIAWTNDLVPNRTYGGYLQVLDAYDASSAGGPTNYGTVLQVNSRNVHWANQLWFPGGAEASKNGLYYRHMAYNEKTYGEWNKLLTNKDVNIIQTQSSSNPSTLPANQIFYSEIQQVTGTPTTQGALFSVQGDDEGIQLWANSAKTELYYRIKWASFGNWIKLATTSDLGNYLPLTGGTLSGNLTIDTVGSTTLVINNNDTNGSETFMRVLRKGTASAAIGFMDSLGAYIYNYNSNKYLFIDNDGYARVGTTSGSTRLALITDIPSVSGYLPLSGGTLTGTLSINSGGSEPLVINNSASAGEAYVVTKTQGTTRGVMGWNASLGMFLQDNRGYTFSVKADGVYFGASSSTLTKLPTFTDLSGYLPLAGGTMTGALTMSSRRHNVVIDVVGGAGNTWDEGAGALSIQIPNDSGQTPLILARRSGAAINTTVATERLLSMELLDNGHSFIIGMSGSEALQLDWTSGKVGTGKLFGKTIATTDQIPSIPSISISNSGSGNAVTAISASGHTLTVTKGATYLTSSSLDGYATQSWSNSQYPLKTGTGASGTWGISISGNATTATTASKLGSTTIGGSAKPIYLSSGTPTACSATVGSATVPVYMNAGTITQCSTTLGVSITGNATTATTATKWNGYSIWTGTEDELPSSRDANTLYFVKKS